MTNHKNRLARLENDHGKPDRPAWRELINADGETWQKIRRDNPDIAQWWDKKIVQLNNIIAMSAQVLENGETVAQRWKRHAEQYPGNQDAQRWARLGELAGRVKQALDAAQARKDANEQP